MMLNNNWVIGADGLPTNPKANPNCRMCNGHGVMEDGSIHYASVLINCPTCIPSEKSCKHSFRTIGEACAFLANLPSNYKFKADCGGGESDVEVDLIVDHKDTSVCVYINQR